MWRRHQPITLRERHRSVTGRRHREALHSTGDVDDDDMVTGELAGGCMGNTTVDISTVILRLASDRHIYRRNTISTTDAITHTHVVPLASPFSLKAIATAAPARVHNHRRWSAIGLKVPKGIAMIPPKSLILCSLRCFTVGVVVYR